MSAAMAQGFTDPPLEAQAMFRLVLDAMARPGQVKTVVNAEGGMDTPAAPGKLDHAAFALALTLLDFETSVWLDPKLAADPPVIEALRFHCGCPIIEGSALANFALIGHPLEAPPLSAFHQGTSEHPDRSTTILMQIKSLDDTRGTRLTGPGIKAEARLAVDGVPPDFWQQWTDNHRQFPLGIDLVLIAGDRLVALPRSVIVEA